MEQIYVVLNKVFDTLPHGKLLFKVEKIKIYMKIMKLIRHWL